MNKEIILENNKPIISSTDKKGHILYVNDYFCEISGFTEDELIGANHNIIRHPDMPKAIFYLMWKSLLKDKKNFKGVIKNRTKNDDFYWVITDFSFEDVENFTIYSATRTKPNCFLIKRVSYIYNRMLEIEKENPEDPIQAPLKFLNDVIHASGYEDYNSFINYLTEETCVCHGSGGCFKERDRKKES